MAAASASETIGAWRARRHPERGLGVLAVSGMALVGLALVWGYVTNPDVQRDWAMGSCVEQMSAVMMYGSPAEVCRQRLGIDR